MIGALIKPLIKGLFIWRIKLLGYRVGSIHRLSRERKTKINFNPHIAIFFLFDCFVFNNNACAEQCFSSRQMFTWDFFTARQARSHFYQSISRQADQFMYIQYGLSARGYVKYLHITLLKGSLACLLTYVNRKKLPSSFAMPRFKYVKKKYKKKNLTNIISLLEKSLEITRKRNSETTKEISQTKLISQSMCTHFL